MKSRLLTAAVCIPLLLLMLLLLPTWVTAWVLAIISALGAYEMVFKTEFVRHFRMTIYTCVCAFAVPLIDYYTLHDGWMVLLISIFVSLLFMEVLLAHTKVRMDKVAICVIAGLIIPRAFTSLSRILELDSGRILVLLPFILAFVPDSGGYFVGRFFGKHKLAPVISPNKTMEGAVGGALTGLMATVLYVVVLRVVLHMDVNYIFAVLYGIVGSGAAIFGDLCLSAVKRQAGIKDYGNLLPGHGGILDRFDSVIFVAPLMEALMEVLPVLG